MKTIPTYTDNRGTVWAQHSSFATTRELYRDPHLAPADRIMHRGLLWSFDKVRLALDHPLFITSGRRSQAGHDALRATNRRAAAVSPHVYGVALDVMVPAYMRDAAFAELFRDSVRETCGILPRLGYVKYREGAKSAYFLHVDVAPLIWREDLPAAWKIEGLIW